MDLTTILDVANVVSAVIGAAGYHATTRYAMPAWKKSRMVKARTKKATATRKANSMRKATSAPDAYTTSGKGDAQ